MLNTRGLTPVRYEKTFKFSDKYMHQRTYPPLLQAMTCYMFNSTSHITKKHSFSEEFFLEKSFAEFQPCIQVPKTTGNAHRCISSTVATDPEQ